jgi:choline dehydrogenase-like flavoprotein
MDKEKIIVIGAGVSGLSCASVLSQKGYEVMVVEATNEIGFVHISNFQIIYNSQRKNSKRKRVHPLEGPRLRCGVCSHILKLTCSFLLQFHGDSTCLMNLIEKNGLACRLMFTWAQGDGELPKHPVGGGNVKKRNFQQ